MVEVGSMLSESILDDRSAGVVVEDGSAMLVADGSVVLVVVPEDGAVEPMFGVVVVSEVMLTARY